MNTTLILQTGTGAPQALTLPQGGNVVINMTGGTGTASVSQGAPAVVSQTFNTGSAGSATPMVILNTTHHVLTTPSGAVIDAAPSRPGIPPGSITPPSVSNAAAPSSGSPFQTGSAGGPGTPPSGYAAMAPQYTWDPAMASQLRPVTLQATGGQPINVLKSFISNPYGTAQGFNNLHPSIAAMPQAITQYMNILNNTSFLGGPQSYPQALALGPGAGIPQPSVVM